MPHERLEMDRDVSEINVQELRLVLREHILEPTYFGVRYLPGRVLQITKPKAAQEMRDRFSNQTDRIEGEARGFLTLLRDYDRTETLQRGDLPVDVQHLRLEKRRAIAGDNRRRALRHA